MYYRVSNGGTTYTHIGTNSSYSNAAGTFSTNVANLPASKYLAIAVAAGGNKGFSNLKITASNGNVEILKQHTTDYGQICVAMVSLTSQGSIVASVTNSSGSSRTNIILTVMK